MWERVRELLALDLAKVDLRRGALGLVAVVLAIIFIAAFGTVGMAAGLAALFAFAADAPGPTGDRVRGVLIMSVVGAAIAYVAVWAGVEHVWVAALLTFGITVVATLAAGYGHAAAIRGLLLSLWAVIALSFAGGDEPALEFSAAYLLGGVAAAAIMLVKTRLPGDVGGADAAAPPQSAPRALAEIVRSKLGVFALVRAVAVGLATVLGIEFFPDHPIWPALTVLIVLRAQPGEAFSIGALRTLGTLAGVLAAEAVISVANGASSVVVAAFLAAAFLMLALQKVNYAVFALFLTMVLVLSQELLGDDADAAASDRFLATLLGSAIAFLGIGIGLWTVRRHGAGPSPSS